MKTHTTATTQPETPALSGLYLDKSATRFLAKPNGLGAIYANLKWHTDPAFSVNVWLHEKPSEETCAQCDQMAEEVIRRWNEHNPMLSAMQSALDAIWAIHGNGYGTEYEKPIADLQNAIIRAAKGAHS